MKMARRQCSLLTVLLYFGCYSHAQKTHVDIFGGALLTYLQHQDIPDESYYYYDLEPKFGYEFFVRAERPVYKSFYATVALGYSKSSFEAQHFSRFLPAADTISNFDYQEYFWSVLDVHYLPASLGLSYHFSEKIKLYSTFKGLVKLGAQESKRRVLLTPIYAGDQFFPAEQQKATGLHQFDIGLSTGVTYQLYKNIYLETSFFMGTRPVWNEKDLLQRFKNRQFNLGIIYSKTM